MMADDFGGMPAREKTPAEKLHDAIVRGDEAAFHAALPKAGDLNADEGKALRLCGQHDRYLFAKALFLQGADIHYALRCCHDILGKIDMKIEIAPMSFGRGKPRRKEDTARFNAASDAVERLYTYLKPLHDDLPRQQLEEISALRARQEQMEKTIEDLRAMVQELTGPRVLEKPKPPQEAAHHDTQTAGQDAGEPAGNPARGSVMKRCS
jgi:hypothetical protein